METFPTATSFAPSAVAPMMWPSGVDRIEAAPFWTAEASVSAPLSAALPKPRAYASGQSSASGATSGLSRLAPWLRLANQEIGVPKVSHVRETVPVRKNRANLFHNTPKLH